MDKNKFQESGVFFGVDLSTINSPRFTMLPPHIYHQNTTPKHALFPQPPSKTPAKQEKIRPAPPQYFFRN